MQKFQNRQLSQKIKVISMCSVVQNLKEKGRFEEIFSSVQEGDYSLERGAQKAGMTIVEFEKAMAEAGYKVPAGV